MRSKCHFRLYGKEIGRQTYLFDDRSREAFFWFLCLSALSCRKLFWVPADEYLSQQVRRWFHLGEPGLLCGTYKNINSRTGGLKVSLLTGGVKISQGGWWEKVEKNQKNNPSHEAENLFWLFIDTFVSLVMAVYP